MSAAGHLDSWRLPVPVAAGCDEGVDSNAHDGRRLSLAESDVASPPQGASAGGEAVGAGGRWAAPRPALRRGRPGTGPPLVRRGAAGGSTDLDRYDADAVDIRGRQGDRGGGRTERSG